MSAIRAAIQKAIRPAIYGPLSDPAGGDPILAAFAVDGILPDLLADFSGENYYKDSQQSTTYSDLITYTGSSLKTMVDSDGNLKWAPHNLLTHSDDPSTSFSSNVDSVWFDANTLFATSQAGAQTPYGREAFTFPSAGTYSFEFEVTDANVQYVSIYFQLFDAGADGLNVFDVQSGSVDTQAANHTASISETPDGYLCKVVVTLDGSDLSGVLDLGISEEAALNRITDPDGTEYAVFRRLRVYRSDLGGMVANPDRGDSYVPTTSSAVYLPRRGHHIYNGSEWVNEGTLVETEARTNLLTYSEDFTQWVEDTNGSLTANQIDGPRGANSAALYEATSNDTFVSLSLTTVGIDASTTATLTLAVKAGTVNWVHARVAGLGSQDARAFFNLSDGSVGTTGADVIGTFVKDMGDGWYECSVAFNTDASDTSGSVQIILASADDDSNVVTGDSIYIDYAQIEVGSTPSSYIPTSGSTVTRAAETLTIPAVNLPYDSTAMSIAMEGKMTYADKNTAFTPLWFNWKADNSNLIRAYNDTQGGNTGLPRFQQVESSTNYLVSASSQNSPGINVPYNIASRHTSSDINGAVDGTALTADTTPTALPDLSAINLSLGSDYMGTIKTFRMFGGTGLTDAQLEEASS